MAQIAATQLSSCRRSQGARSWATATPATLVPPAPPLPDKTVPVFGLKAKVAKLVFRKETLNGVEGDVSVQGNLLKLSIVKIADLLGAKLDVQGSVTDFGTAPFARFSAQLAPRRRWRRIRGSIRSAAAGVTGRTGGARSRRGRRT